MIVNFHIGGESCNDPIVCNARVQYWPKGVYNKSVTLNASNIFFDLPEEKATRLLYARKINNLTADTLYAFRVAYFDYNLKKAQNSPIKYFRTFPNDPKTNKNFTVAFGGDISNLHSSIEMHKTIAKHNPYAAFVGKS